MRSVVLTFVSDNYVLSSVMLHIKVRLIVRAKSVVFTGFCLVKKGIGYVKPRLSNSLLVGVQFGHRFVCAQLDVVADVRCLR